VMCRRGSAHTSMARSCMQHSAYSKEGFIWRLLASEVRIWKGDV